MKYSTLFLAILGACFSGNAIATQPSDIDMAKATSTLTFDPSYCPKVTVRKEMNDLTEEEWDIYKKVMLMAATEKEPSSNLTWIEYAAKIHHSLAKEVHDTSLFFFWHRQLLLWFERKLQEFDSRFSMFYWDTSREFNQLASSKIWKYIGSPFCPNGVQDGIYKGIVFNLTGKPIIRNYNTSANCYPVSYWGKLYQDSIGSRQGYNGWQKDAQYAHGAIHVLIGGKIGTMATMYSPLDPLFWSHHAFIDKQWVDSQVGWVSSSLPVSAQIGGKLADKSDCTLHTALPAFGNKTCADVLDPRYLCYRYALPGESVDSTVPSSTATTTTTAIPTKTDCPAGYPGCGDSIPGATTTAEYSTVPGATATAIASSSPIKKADYLTKPVDYLPENYTESAAPPPPLPDYWLKMNYPHSNVTKIVESVKNVMSEVQKLSKKGESPIVPPMVQDIWQPPPINPSYIPKSVKSHKHKCSVKKHKCKSHKKTPAKDTTPAETEPSINSSSTESGNNTFSGFAPSTSPVDTETPNTIDHSLAKEPKELAKKNTTILSGDSTMTWNKYVALTGVALTLFLF